jgi:hypothetical protein
MVLLETAKVSMVSLINFGVALTITLSVLTSILITKLKRKLMRLIEIKRNGQLCQSEMLPSLENFHQTEQLWSIARISGRLKQSWSLNPALKKKRSIVSST